MTIKTWQDKYSGELENEIVDRYTQLRWAQQEIDELRARMEVLEESNGMLASENIRAFLKLDSLCKVKAALEAQEPVAWRYHSVSPFAKDGEWAVSKKWSLIHAPNQRDAHSASCGMVAEPLYAAAGAKP